MADFLPVRTFSAAQGDQSKNLAGPEQIMHDLDMLCAMFDPNATHDDEAGTPGGLNLANTQLVTPDQSISGVGFAGNGSALTILSHVVRILKLITGETNWYNTPDSTIAELALAISNLASATVNLSQLESISTGSVLYRKTAGSGPPEAQTLATLRTDLGIIDPTELEAGSVTLDKLANISSGSLLYRKTAGSGPPEEQTLATLRGDLGIIDPEDFADDSIALAKLEYIDSGKVLYRKTAEHGAVEAQTLATLKTDLGGAVSVDDSNKTTGVTAIKLYTCTQAEYDAIGSPDAATLYIIKGA